MSLHGFYSLIFTYQKTHSFSLLTHWFSEQKSFARIFHEAISAFHDTFRIQHSMYTMLIRNIRVFELRIETNFEVYDPRSF